ncbi:protein of unknown function [Rhodovastum atsumiense]|nr:protein of unknown function [Rhodovastum atsumiense]
MRERAREWDKIPRRCFNDTEIVNGNCLSEIDGFCCQVSIFSVPLDPGLIVALRLSLSFLLARSGAVRWT